MNCVENGRRFDSCWELFTRNAEPVSEISISKELSSNPCVSHVFDFNSIQGFIRASVRHLLASSAGGCGKEMIRTLDSGNISETRLVLILKPSLQISSAYRCLSGVSLSVISCCLSKQGLTFNSLTDSNQQLQKTLYADMSYISMSLTGLPYIP